MRKHMLWSSLTCSALGPAGSALLLLLATAAHGNTPTPAPVAAAADLQLRAVAKTFQVGVTGFYSLSVINGGPNATNAPMTLSTDLPTGLSFASISGGWSCDLSGQSLSCVNGNSLPANTSLGIDLGVNVGTAAVPSVQILLTISYDGDTSSGNNSVFKATSVRPSRHPISTPTATATTTPSFGTPVHTRTPTRTPPPTITRTATSTRTPIPNLTDVSLKKTNFGAFTVGTNGTYILSVSNLGSASTNTTITVVDTLPPSLGFVSGTGTDWSCSAIDQTVTCDLSGPVDPGAISTITLVVSVSSAAYPTVTNSATVSYAGDTDLTNNLARKPTTVKQSRTRPVRNPIQGPIH